MLKEPPICPKDRTRKKVFIKSLPCAAAGMHKIICCEGVDEAHYKKGSFAGKNMKNHKRTVPLCRLHHSKQGDIGEISFWGSKPIAALSDDLHETFLENNKDKAFYLIARFRRSDVHFEIY